MNIVVCIKQVPDTTEIKLDPVKGTLIRDGVPSIMNPDDKGGLEFALRLKDKFGANVTVSQWVRRRRKPYCARHTPWALTARFC